MEMPFQSNLSIFIVIPERIWFRRFRCLMNFGFMSNSVYSQVGKAFSELLFGPVDAGFHRADGDMELPGHRLIGALELIAQSQDGLIPGRELLDGRLKLVSSIFEKHPLLGGLRFSCRDGVAFQQVPVTLAFTDEFQSQADGDAK